MYRLAATVVLSSAAFAQNAPDPEIVRAAKSPYGLARYIDSHSGFEWGPLWRVLALSASIIPCGHAGVCSTELIQVLDPAQTILVIDMQYTSEVYVRYLGSESSGWRRAGAYEAHIRNYPRRHGIVRVGGKPFLQVASQGVSGSDVSSEVESWFDLSQPELSPAFSFTSQGHQHRLGFGVSRTIHASASPEGIGQTDSIRLIVQVRYSGFDTNLGEGDYSATYERLPRNKNFTLSKARSIT